MDKKSQYVTIINLYSNKVESLWVLLASSPLDLDLLDLLLMFLLYSCVSLLRGNGAISRLKQHNTPVFLCRL